MNKYLAADDNKFIHKKYIHWAQLINERMEVCCKVNGCTIGVDTITVSKKQNPYSYSVLEEMFLKTAAAPPK